MKDKIYKTADARVRIGDAIEQQWPAAASNKGHAKGDNKPYITAKKGEARSQLNLTTKPEHRRGKDDKGDSRSSHLATYLSPGQLAHAREEEAKLVHETMLRQELSKFRTEVEQKHRLSITNKSYKFPRAAAEDAQHFDDHMDAELESGIGGEIDCKSHAGIIRIDTVISAHTSTVRKLGSGPRLKGEAEEKPQAEARSRAKTVKEGKAKQEHEGKRGVEAGVETAPKGEIAAKLERERKLEGERERERERGRTRTQVDDYFASGIWKQNTVDARVVAKVLQRESSGASRPGRNHNTQFLTKIQNLLHRVPPPKHSDRLEEHEARRQDSTLSAARDPLKQTLHIRADENANYDYMHADTQPQLDLQRGKNESTSADTKSVLTCPSDTKLAQALAGVNKRPTKSTSGKRTNAGVSVGKDAVNARTTSAFTKDPARQLRNQNRARLLQAGNHLRGRTSGQPADSLDQAFTELSLLRQNTSESKPRGESANKNPEYFDTNLKPGGAGKSLLRHNLKLTFNIAKILTSLNTNYGTIRPSSSLLKGKPVAGTQPPSRLRQQAVLQYFA